MAYNYLTQWDSPNYTPAAQTRTTWGVNRQIKEIAIHWWGDPNTKPSFEGVVGGFLHPGGLSAHYVATGTGRRVACLVSPQDNAWATGPGNPYTIAIECDPRARAEDYDVVAELIADIRSAYGNLALVKHSKYVKTACPGVYDLKRLNDLAKNKVSQKEWGKVTNKVEVKPKAKEADIKAAYLAILERPADADGLAHYLKSGLTIAQVKTELLKSSEYSQLQNKKAREAAALLAAKQDEAAKQAALDKLREDRDKACIPAATEVDKMGYVKLPGTIPNDAKSNDMVTIVRPETPNALVRIMFQLWQKIFGTK